MTHHFLFLVDGSRLEPKDLFPEATKEKMEKSLLNLRYYLLYYKGIVKCNITMMVGASRMPYYRRQIILDL